MVNLELEQQKMRERWAVIKKQEAAKKRKEKKEKTAKS